MTKSKTLGNLKQQLGADEIKVVERDKNPEQVKHDRVMALLNEQVPAPNEFVAYLVKSAHEKHGEVQHLQEVLGNLNQQLAQTQTRLIELKGQQNKIVEDIMYWDKELKR